MPETSSRTPTEELARAGVSIWLDDLSRERLDSGSLQRLIDTRGVVGVTTNPTIFASAIGRGDAYAARLADLAEAGVDAETAVFELTTTDVRDACDLFRPIFDATGGKDGRVSIEVSPLLAHDTNATIAEARRLWATVDRPNAMIKIPATIEGLSAITAAVAAGISVNATLIFSLERHAAVVDAYLNGLEQAATAGIDLSAIHSVASFFISRVDTEVDARLGRIPTYAAQRLKGLIAVSNARLAHQLARREFAADRAQVLLAAGANPQRPLWASTGVKDPTLPDTLYVTGLALDGTVNTMPEATLEALAGHGAIPVVDPIGQIEQAERDLQLLDAIGVDLSEVTSQLEAEGVEKFVASWLELLDTVSLRLSQARFDQNGGILQRESPPK